MTADRFADAIHTASWIPSERSTGVDAGVHFDAVRVCKNLAEDVVSAMKAERIGGPVVWREDLNQMHFLVAAGTAGMLRWPPGVVVLDASRPVRVTVPALWGNTYPLWWRSKPTGGAPLVDTAALHRVVCALTEWPSLPELLSR